MGIPDHLTCFLRNLYAGQEATARTGRGTTVWFQIGKGVRQGCILSPCLLNVYAEFSSVQSLVRVQRTQTHVHRVSNTIQPSHPLLSPSPPTFNLS